MQLCRTMELSRFVTLCFIFFNNLFHKSNNSLLSRSKNTYLYVPRLLDHIEPIDIDDVYDALKGEVPSIKMFRNEMEKVFKNVFKTVPKNGKQSNRRPLINRKYREKIRTKVTEPPTIEELSSESVWRKTKTWHYISHIIPNSTTPNFFIRRPTISESPATTKMLLLDEFTDYVTETSKITSKIDSKTIFKFMPIPSSWKEDQDDDNVEDKNSYDEKNEVIVNFENYTYKIPYSITTARKTSTTEMVTTTENFTTMKQSGISTVTQKYIPITTTEHTTKRPLADNFIIFNGTKKGQCYRCGIDKGRSQNSFCYDVFNSNKYEYQSMARFLRTICYDNPSVRHGKNVKWPLGYDKFKITQYTDEGLETKFYGSYSGGCFKRFLDIGNFHTQRGCRQWPPDGYRFRRGYVEDYTTQQYRDLEWKLGESERNACVYSLHASLVPFSRDVSLFARHHVCVCTGIYCNAAINIYSSYVRLFVGTIYLVKCLCYYDSCFI